LGHGSVISVPGKTEAFQISGTTELNKSVDLVSSFLLARSVPFRNGLRTGSDVTGMGADDALGRLSFVDTDTVQVHRGSGDGSAPQFFARGTAVEFASSMVASVQRGSIALGGGVTSNTATISSVDPTRSVVVFLGNDSDTATIDRIFPKVELTNAATVTASRTSGTGTIHVGFAVIEFAPGVVSQIQQVSKTLNDPDTSGNVTLTSVDTSRTVCFPRGFTVGGNSSMANTVALGYLADTTTFTVERNASAAGATVTYEATVVEFNASYVSVQRGRTTMASVSSATASVTSVAQNQSFPLLLGFKTSGSGGTESQVFGTVHHSAANTITVERGEASIASLTLSWELVTMLV